MPAPKLNDPRLPERFWAKIAEDPGTGCWNWIAAVTREGYGKYYPGLGCVSTSRSPHRVAYESLVQPVPDTLVLDHTCHDPALCAGGASCLHRRCANPNHLEPVTERVNIRRGSRVAGLRARTHCPSGHEYLANNALTTPAGVPVCRICRGLRDDFDPSTSRGNYSLRADCPQGHPYTPDNTYVSTSKSGRTSRQCRTCRRNRNQSRRSKTEVGF